MEIQKNNLKKANKILFIALLCVYVPLCLAALVSLVLALIYYSDSITSGSYENATYMSFASGAEAKVFAIKMNIILSVGLFFTIVIPIVSKILIKTQKLKAAVWLQAGFILAGFIASFYFWIPQSIFELLRQTISLFFK